MLENGEIVCTGSYRELLMDVHFTKYMKNYLADNTSVQSKIIFSFKY
jgi:hypothetical protein